ncbi:MAG: lysozyme inhibitor LprI family protein [Steroidobacteraceae bacterium]
MKRPDGRNKELNQTYRKLLSEAENQSGAAAKVAAMERAWVTYRDRYMAAMYPAKDKQTEYGSGYPMEADLLLAQLTEVQINALEALLKQYAPAAH